MLIIEALNHCKLSIASWQIHDSQPWCVLGKNGSGKDYLGQLLTGQLKPSSAKICELPPKNQIALVSFEQQQRIFEHELKIDRTDYLNENDIGTLARNFLPEDKLADPLIESFGLSHCLSKGYRQLSTGEARKLLILSAILNGARLLICDNPFDSLDHDSCIALSTALQGLIKKDINVLLLLSNRQDIPAWCENVALLANNQLTVIGKLQNEETKSQLDLLLAPKADKIKWPEPVHTLDAFEHKFLVKLNNGRVHYGDKKIFDGVDLSVKPLQHTLITGKNGSGKSTLMQLITGDCTQCYSNDLEVLGFKRGSGESIWQLKKQMGIVSAELHRQYRVNGELLTVVLSGLYDTIGLYQKPENHSIKIAQQWLEKVGLLSKQHCLFKSLSYGEQRLALIARALVKSPYLLILDEPTQGLDGLNRHRVLSFIEYLAEQKHSTILLVSHREDEFLTLFEQHIRL